MDARLGSRADNMIAVERLLSISGEDTITIDRKYRDPWTGRLPARFMILTNELPRFSDSSGGACGPLRDDAPARVVLRP
jgi:putative DNA primase/helicase